MDLAAAPVDGEPQALARRGEGELAGRRRPTRKPNVALGVVPKSGAVMLIPAGATGETSYDKFKKIACGQALTADQKVRVSHFRVKLKE
jgi:hypothetical protein